MDDSGRKRNSWIEKDIYKYRYYLLNKDFVEARKKDMFFLTLRIKRDVFAFNNSLKLVNKARQTNSFSYTPQTVLLLSYITIAWTYRNYP